MANNEQLIPAVRAQSRKDFRPPATLESDFHRFLMHENPYVYWFDVIHDWYAEPEELEDGEHLRIRAQQTPIDWKSKIGNSDMSTNFKTERSNIIRKGDIVRREDGMLYMLTWNVTSHPNNYASQSTEMNTMFEITRHIPDKADRKGFLIEKAHDEVIVSDMPGIHTEYAGRPDYMASQGTPGINADNLITCSLQWNRKTRNIRINDEFKIGIFTYRVVNIVTSEVSIDGEYGVIGLHAKRVAGGMDE